ncbi:MAG TPA: glycosyltransferase [Actinomycetota bacterium]|nr:glycosyltransferase [Actinomycetota bacterium]
MLPEVPVHDRRLDEYREAAGDEAVERLRDVAEPLKGLRLLHLNSTSFGGGVAELLFTQVGLLRDLGIDAHWHLIEGAEDFFTVTKAAHNGLQGAEVAWTETMEEIYLERLRANARALTDTWDVTFVHDPQPAAIRTILAEEGETDGTWVWRCHIDLSAPFEPVWEFLARWVESYDTAVFTSEEFVRPGFSGPRIAIVPPSIDPLSPKNAWLDHEVVWDVVRRYGVDTQRPIALQVSRFDPWKDPIGVIEAYRIAKRSVPDLQLAMIGSIAADDPEGWHYLQVTQHGRDCDPNVHLLTNLQEVGNLEVNAFQRAATVVLQKSLREGFGLTVSEACGRRRRSSAATSPGSGCRSRKA